MPATRRSRVPVLASRARRALALALAAVLLLGVGVALAKIKSGRYAGTTSEKGPVALTISGKKITHFKAILGYNGKCGPGGGPGLTAAPASMTIGSNGTFSQNTTLSLTGISTPIHDPGRVFGKVSGSTATGTIEQFLHGKVNKCYIETFTARRK
ncbi:MAG TPA: hypothetical protein VII01_10875 [Solirubrobacteraceae bacterium]|jgi:hypothetical protein